MSSSTSSSEHQGNQSSRQSIKSHAMAWVLAVAGIVVLEIMLRVFGSTLSMDTRHLIQIPARVRELADKPSPRILFLGNSTTRQGVDVELLNGRFHSDGVEAGVASIFPDDSYVREWAYLFGKIYPGDTGPDALVISFTGSWLEDAPVYQPERLAHFFTGTPDVGRGLVESETFSKKARFVMGRISATAVYKERIRKLFLHRVVPGYERLANAANQATRSIVSDVEPKPIYTQLKRLMEMAERRNTRLILVALPTPHPYELSPVLRSVLKQGGADLFDLRGVTTGTGDCFSDDIHLSARGATRLTSALAEALIPYFKSEK